MQVISQKSFRMSNSIGASERVLEQRNLGWCEGEYHEQHTNQADDGKGKPRVATWQPIISEYPPFKKKDQGGGDIKDGDIDPVWGFAEHAVIGVEQNWNQYKPQEDLCQFDTPVVFLIFEEQSLNQRKEK